MTAKNNPRKNPWMKFYPSDWRSDPKLRMCSLAARGLWMEMLCVMHEANPRGHLLVSGKAPSEMQLCTLLGIMPDQLHTLLCELEQADVFSRNRAGTIFSRRMIADEKAAEKARKDGKKGGNPSLTKQTKKSVGVKGQDKAQMPDARSQRPELSSYPSQKEETYQLGDTRDEPSPFDEPTMRIVGGSDV